MTPQATRVELLGAPVVNDHTWTMNTPLFVNEYLGFFVIFNSTKTGEFSNTVLGSSLQTPDKKPATDIVRVVHPEYVIEKIALVEGEVNVGDEVRFEIIVHNTGEIDVTDIEIQENPDSGLQYVTYEVEEGQWNKTGSVWKLNSDIVSDGYAAFIVVYKVTKSGNLTNTITSGDKTAKAVVTVNKTNETTPENNTVPDNNNTSPADNDDDNQQENTDPVDEDEGTDVPSDSDSDSPSGKTLKVNDKYATGNPILALLVVLISVVLIRRRE